MLLIENKSTLFYLTDTHELVCVCVCGGVRVWIIIVSLFLFTYILITCCLLIREGLFCIADESAFIFNAVNCFPTVYIISHYFFVVNGLIEPVEVLAFMHEVSSPITESYT